MHNILTVYDVESETFFQRRYKKRGVNCNTVAFFSRKIIEEIEKHYIICGFMLINKRSHHVIPIDIEESHISVLELHLNSIPYRYLRKWGRFSLYEKPDIIFSKFFLELQLEGIYSSSQREGGGIALSAVILHDSDLVSQMIKENISIYQPSTYSELCVMVQRVLRLLDMDFFKYDYQIKYKYLIDSLQNNYHINFSKEDIEGIWYQFCEVILARKEEF